MIGDIWQLNLTRELGDVSRGGGTCKSRPSQFYGVTEPVSRERAFD